MIATLNRDQIVSRFEEWLDRVLQMEEPPEGIDAEILNALNEGGVEAENVLEETSSHAFWSAMTALSQDVKLQGRSFKELTAAIDSQGCRLADEIRAAYREGKRNAEREAERRPRKELLNALVDLRDRLERGLQTATQSAAEISKAGRESWLARHFSKAVVDSSQATISALIRGYELGLEHLDQKLEEFDARPVRALGQPFDPHSMNAIEKQESSKVPEGTVLEVYRTGYECNGEVFRPAQVKVSVAAKGVKAG